MAKWDYKITQMQLMLTPPLDMKKPKNQESLDHMNQMGKEGWELVSAQPNQTGATTCFWKREVKAPIDEWTT